MELDYEAKITKLLDEAKARRVMGAETYGHLDFLTKDLGRDIREEILDTISYLLFLIIKTDSWSKESNDKNTITTVIPPETWGS